MQRNSGKFALVLAIVFGLAASLLVWSYLKKVSEPVDTVAVVVAATDISPRTALKKEMLRIQQVPANVRHPKGYASVDDLLGKVTKLAITGGEQVLETKIFAEREESGLAFVIPPNKRAVSVGVSELIGSGGLIVPSDRVDVVAVFDSRVAGKDMATMVLQDVEVLAVAQLIQGEDSVSLTTKASKTVAGGSQAQPKADPKVQPTAKSVTLAVTPDEAQRLILAEEKGKIRLALRPYGDTGKANLSEAVLAAARTTGQ
ncbi:MAG: Flp pilus assembly protein CpaB [Chloroflexi bacterium]|nr:Flp pilus assembly protein CpaB [Chloroflexota bacterium]